MIDCNVTSTQQLFVVSFVHWTLQNKCGVASSKKGGGGYAASLAGHYTEHKQATNRKTEDVYVNKSTRQPAT